MSKNSSSSSSSSSSGIGFLGLLTIVFITLKLTGFINWSWWLVTIPLWGGFAAFFGCVAIAFIIAVLCDWLGGKKK